MTRTGDLITSDFDGGLIAEVRALRADVELLKRAGFAKESADDPGSLLSKDESDKIASVQAFTGAHQVLVGTGPGTGTVTDIAANATVGRAGTAVVGGIGISADEVVGREGSGSLGGVTAASDSVLAKLGSGNLGFTAATASQFFAQLSTGDLGFKSRDSLVADMDILAGEAWEFDDITASMTLTEGKMGGLFNHSADATVTLPTPANSGAVFFVADPLGLINGTSRQVRFGTAGASDEINGSTGLTAQFGRDFAIFLFIGTLDSGNAKWVFKSV